MKQTNSQRRRFVRSQEIADALGVSKKTVLRHTRLGRYRGVLGGGSEPYLYPAEKMEKQLGLEAGSLTKALS